MNSDIDSVTITMLNYAIDVRHLNSREAVDLLSRIQKTFPKLDLSRKQIRILYDAITSVEEI